MRSRTLFLTGLLLFMTIQMIFSQTPGTLKWEFNTGAAIYSSPAIKNDGTIYVGSNKLYAINPDGIQKWAFTATNHILSSPAIGSDGTIYFGCLDNKLYAINPNGTQKWNFATGKQIATSSPAIGSDGTIYIGSDDNYFYAVNLNGTLKWYTYTGGFIVRSAPAISSDGTVYFCSHDGTLYAFNDEGKQKWTFNIGGSYSSPAIGTDGLIYIGSDDSKLYAINPNGSLKWAFSTGYRIHSSPAISSDGTLYVGSWDHKLYAINSDGSPKWAFTTGDLISSSPAIGSDGIVYLGSDDRNLYAINPDGSPQWAFTTGDQIISSPAIGSDGTVYVGSTDGKLYAIHCSSKGSASSPWPKFGQSNNNRGVYPCVTIYDKQQFRFVNAGENTVNHFSISNTLTDNISLSQITFNNLAIKLESSLPLIIPSGTRDSLVYSIDAEKTGLYKSNCKLAFQTNAIDGAISDSLQGNGIFIEDGSEKTLIAHQAYDLYSNALSKDAGSIATKNNLGVLYYLLGELDQADNNISRAYKASMGASYGYAGVSVNMGVIQSEQKKPEEAKPYYIYAASHNANVAANKAYYNLAWEAYQQDSLTTALGYLQHSLVDSFANSFLKAKSFVLRGAIRFRLAQITLARDDFNQAITLDPHGPIGKMARENLDIIKTTAIAISSTLAPDDYTLLPNYPNPFNPVTTIRFALPKKTWVELEIYNVNGQRICTLLNQESEAGWQQMVWNGKKDAGEQVGSGVYLLHLKCNDFSKIQKMTLIR